MAGIPGFDMDIPAEGLPEAFTTALKQIFDDDNPILAEQTHGTVEFRVHYLNARKAVSNPALLEFEVEHGFSLAAVQKAEGNTDDLILIYTRQKPNARQAAIMLIQQAVDVQFFRNLQQVLALTASEQVRAVMADVVGDTEENAEETADFLAELEAMERAAEEAGIPADPTPIGASEAGFAPPLDESTGPVPMDPEDAKIVDEILGTGDEEEEDDGS